MASHEPEQAEQAKPAPAANPQTGTKMIYIEPAGLMMVGIGAGFIIGFLMVALDPWLRFPQAPIHINWREGLLTASMLGVYAALLGWTLTTFWRQRALWIISLMLVPILTGIIAAWNSVNAALGVESDLLIFLPVVTVFHLLMMGMMVIYMNLVLRFDQRRTLVYGVLPIVLVIFVLLGLGRLRWSNPDAKDVVEAVDFYANQVVEGDYSIEYIGMQYRDNIAPTGDARVHTDEGVLRCRVRLFANNTDISCQPEN